MKSFYLSVIFTLIISISSIGQIQKRYTGLKGIEYLSSVRKVYGSKLYWDPDATVWGKFGLNVFNNMTIDAGISLAIHEEDAIKMLFEPGVEYQVFQKSLLAPKFGYHLVFPADDYFDVFNLGVGAVYLYYTDLNKGVNVIRPNVSIALLGWVAEVNLGYNIRLSEKEKGINYNKFNIGLIMRLPLSNIDSVF